MRNLTDIEQRQVGAGSGESVNNTSIHNENAEPPISDFFAACIIVLGAASVVALWYTRITTAQSFFNAFEQGFNQALL